MEILNFNAGPSYINKEVMAKAIDFINNKSKVGGLEISHRGQEITSLFSETKELIKELMKLDYRYEVLFLHGGARLQNCMIPYNIAINKKAYYIDTGIWSMNSYNEASIIRDCEILASSAKEDYSYIPKNIGWNNIDNAAYLHLTSNNTVHGAQFFDYSEFSTGTIIADMSSDILSRDIDYNQFGIIYAGLQKNLGTAGGSLVVIDRNLIDSNLNIPSMLDYNSHINAESMLNTPPVFTVLMCNLVLKWIKASGGISVVEQNNIDKANLLYSEIDKNDMFEAFVRKEDRSLMNATFKLNDEKLETSFNTYLDKNGVIGYKGHRSKGGYRISMYNMLPIEDVERFVQLIKNFKG